MWNTKMIVLYLLIFLELKGNLELKKMFVFFFLDFFSTDGIWILILFWYF